MKCVVENLTGRSRERKSTVLTEGDFPRFVGGTAGYLQITDKKLPENVT